MASVSLLSGSSPSCPAPGLISRAGNEPTSLHVISNLARLQEVRNRGAKSLLHFLLISSSSSCQRSQISTRKEKKQNEKRVSGHIHAGGWYTASLSEQSQGGVRCGGAKERGGLLGLQEPGMLIGKIVLIRPSSLQMLGEASPLGPHRREGSSQPDIVSKHNWHNIRRAVQNSTRGLLCVCICLKGGRGIYHDKRSGLTNAQRLDSTCSTSSRKDTRISTDLSESKWSLRKPKNKKWPQHVFSESTSWLCWIIHKSHCQHVSHELLFSKKK